MLRFRKATPNANYSRIIDTIKSLVDEAESKIRFSSKPSLGICTPGAISPASGLMKNSNTTCLNGKPLKQDLEKALGREVRIANDANCFALSEAVDGSASDADVVFGVIIGTGVGAGIVIRQNIISGTNAIAGEWGHNPLPWPKQDELPGMPCYCGKKGCIETFLSGPALAKHHEQNTGVSLSTLEIVARAETGDKSCEATLKIYENRLARGLAHIINILDPGAIVLGGGLSNIQRLYENVPLIWQEYVFSDHVSTQLLPPVFGDSSGIRGAAWLWND